MNNGQWSGGKGSNPRKVNKRAYDEAYDSIFRKAPDPVKELKPEEDITAIASEEDITDNISFKKDDMYYDEYHNFKDVENSDLEASHGCIFITIVCIIFWVLFLSMLHLFNFYDKL